MYVCADATGDPEDTSAIGHKFRLHSTRDSRADTSGGARLVAPRYRIGFDPIRVALSLVVKLELGQPADCDRIDGSRWIQLAVSPLEQIAGVPVQRIVEHVVNEQVAGGDKDLDPSLFTPAEIQQAERVLSKPAVARIMAAKMFQKIQAEAHPFYLQLLANTRAACLRELTPTAPGKSQLFKQS